MERPTIRLIIDTNQVQAVCNSCLPVGKKRSIKIVLPMDVLFEVAQAPNLIPKLKNLLDYDLRFGMGDSDIFDSFQQCTDAQLFSFDPVLERGSKYDRMCRSLIRGESAAVETFRVTGREQRKHRSEMMSKIASKVQDLAKNVRDRESRGESFEKLEGVTDVLGTCRTVCNRLAILYQYDRCRLSERFYLFMVCHHLGYGNCLANTDLNVTASHKPNDVFDWFVPLCARDGDVIVTMDKRFKERFRLIDPEGRVKLVDWDSHEKRLRCT